MSNTKVTCKPDHGEDGHNDDRRLRKSKEIKACHGLNYFLKLFFFLDLCI